MKLGIDDAAAGISEEGGPYPPYIIEDALLPEAVLKVKSQKRVYLTFGYSTAYAHSMQK